MFVPHKSILHLFPTKLFFFFIPVEGGGYSSVEHPCLCNSAWKSCMFSFCWGIPRALLPSALLFLFILWSDELDHPESTFLIQNINTLDFLWTAESKESKQANQRNRSACGLGRSWLPLGCLDMSPSLQFQLARGCQGKHRLPSPIAQCPLPSKTCFFYHRPKAHDCCLSQLMGTPSLPLQTFGVCQSHDNLAVSRLVGVAFLYWWLQW